MAGGAGDGHVRRMPDAGHGIYLCQQSATHRCCLLYTSQMLFTNAGASRELLEGITMLIAVVMLFFMSYWRLSKVEARHWKAWLEGKLSHSCLLYTSGNHHWRRDDPRRGIVGDP